MSPITLTLPKLAKRIPLFAALNEADWERIAYYMTLRQFRRGEYIFFEGDRPSSLYIVWEGKVKLVRHSSSGRDVVLAVVGTGRLLGDIALFQNCAYTSSAQALDKTSILILRRDQVFQLMEKHPAISKGIIMDLSRRLHTVSDLVQSLAVDRVRQRIIRILLKLAKAAGKETPQGIILDIPLTRQDLADMTGTTVETAIRVMSELRKDHLVCTEQGRILICDIETLYMIAEDEL